MIPGHPPDLERLERRGATDAFVDPAYYDLVNRERAHDVAMYVALARASGGPVLEHGCGNGRITLPMARAGVDVTGIDRSAAMIDDLRRKLALDRPPGRVRVRRADMRAARTVRRFPLVICPFNTFLHLYTRDDVARYVARVRAALDEDGRFVMDASVPRPADLLRGPDEPLRGRSVRWQGKRWSYAERFTYAPLEQVLYVTSELSPDDGGPPVRRLLAHRQWFPAELEAALHAGGLRVEEVWGGFEREPAHDDPDLLVWSCSRRR